MKKHWKLGLVLALAGSLAIFPATSAGHEGPHPEAEDEHAMTESQDLSKPSVKVNVTLNEWKVVPSVQKVNVARAGAAKVAGKAVRVAFMIKNKGLILHELVIMRTNLPPDKLSTKIRKSAHGKSHMHVKAGGTGHLVVTLKPGKYVLFCDLPMHYKAGQRVGFTVA